MNLFFFFSFLLFSFSFFLFSSSSSLVLLLLLLFGYIGVRARASIGATGLFALIGRKRSASVRCLGFESESRPSYFLHPGRLDFAGFSLSVFDIATSHAWCLGVLRFSSWVMTHFVTYKSHERHTISCDLLAVGKPEDASLANMIGNKHRRHHL